MTDALRVPDSSVLLGDFLRSLNRMNSDGALNEPIAVATKYLASRTSEAAPTATPARTKTTVANAKGASKSKSSYVTSTRAGKVVSSKAGKALSAKKSSKGRFSK